MRHAEAEKMGGLVKRDAERPLTDYGRSQAKAVAAELKRRGLAQTLVLCSPYVRTAQTAHIITEALRLRPPQTAEEIAATGYAPNLNALLQKFPGENTVIMIGHQPDIGMAVEQVMGFEFGFSPATLIAFEKKDSEPWRYLWMVKPEDTI